MFIFSSKTVVNREFKVSEFLKQIKADKEVKSDSKFVKRIFFQNVINADSINVEEDPKFKIIYVIKMELEEEIVPKLFVEAIDKSMAFHTYFIFECNGKFASMISFKEIGKSIKIGPYYGHGFHEDIPIELPSINSVADVYKQILSYEIGLKPRKDETPNEFITRYNLIKRLEFQISKTEKAIMCETQPKKKFEYNERLRKYRKDLEELKKTED